MHLRRINEMTDKQDDKNRNSKDTSSDKNKENPDMQQNEGMNRRKFIKNTGMVAGGVVGRSLTNQFLTKPEMQPGMIQAHQQ